MSIVFTKHKRIN